MDSTKYGPVDSSGEEIKTMDQPSAASRLCFLLRLLVCSGALLVQAGCASTGHDADDSHHDDSNGWGSSFRMQP
jgi:hypothetical protein